MSRDTRLAHRSADGSSLRGDSAVATDGSCALKNEVQACLDAGELAAAATLCRQRIAQRPQSADAHRYLSQVLAASRKFSSAQRSARHACELAPADPRAWSDLGRIQALQGQLAEAAASFRAALRIDPQHADAWHNLGMALRLSGDRDGAFTALKKALTIDPARADTYLNLGNLLIESGQYDDAVECFERAARHDPTLAAARSRLAQQMSERGNVERAQSLFRQSLGLDPDHLAGWFGLGRALEDLGEAEGALGCYRNVLARTPDHAHALGQYLALVKGEAEPQIVARARAALTNPQTSDDARALIGYGFAKYHDRRREPQCAADAGLAANAARRRLAGPLDRRALERRIDGIMATCDRDFFETRRRFGVGNDQPVFIVGLPRSGTTLTEQILSSHPSLHGAGELADLSRIAARCVATDDEPWQAATRLNEMTSREHAGEYLRSLHKNARRGCLRICDKSPLNFFHLAVAALLFPNARVIHCRRDARDNALSIWMENFNPDQRYATDFSDLAFFRAQYERLMAHWREHLPLRILEVQYEDTVAQLESQARRLLEFVGAPWDERCLDFHRNDRAVQTPSRWQVRQPIYTRSVHRWRRYAHALPGLLEAFPASDPA